MQPTKRKRTGGEPDGSDGIDSDPVRSDIWFDDGNIIVQAQNMQFRVYKGVLCNRSEVLKAAIEDIVDSKGVEGCPLLLLSDSSVDVAYVFRAIFDRWSYRDNEPLPFDVIAAFMRLGRKYEIPPLYDSALHRLLYSFSFSVEKYTAETTILTKLILFNDPQDGRRRREIVIDTILLARELDLPFLLPAAFWFAATNIDSLVEPNTPSISKADRNAILSAAKPLCMAYANYVLGWLDEELPDCSKPVTCRHAKAEYSLKVWKPPGPSLVLYWSSSSSKGLCRSCIAAGKKHFSEGVTRLWNELPSFFKLPPWEELLAGVPNVQELGD